MPTMRNSGCVRTWIHRASVCFSIPLTVSQPKSCLAATLETGIDAASNVTICWKRMVSCRCGSAHGSHSTGVERQRGHLTRTGVYWSKT